MAKTRPISQSRSNTDVRAIMLQYFYNRNSSATSARGKKGFAIKITDIRKELKASHGLTQQEVIGNLNYLLSQGWIEEDKVEKSVPLKTGTVIPQSTSYYKITAAGIDKIEGPGEYTMDKFRGIRIEATGRNIITVGDGNQVNESFADVATALVDLKKVILESEEVSEPSKLDAVADIESIQNQLAKTAPNRTIIQSAWETIRNLNAVGGLTEKIATTAGYLAEYL